MRILVCVKSVPDLESIFRLNSQGNFYEPSGLKFHINEYDLYAIESAVRVKERFKDARITVISVGPSRVEAEIKKAMELGADEGFRIDVDDAQAEDAFWVSGLIASFAKERGFELILCGVMSQDLERAQVGPMVAQLLRIPYASTVIALNLLKERNLIICERELEQGEREKIEVPLPALLTIQSGIYPLRYPSLSNKLRVKHLKIPSLPPKNLWFSKRIEPNTRAYFPEVSSGCEFLEGDAEKVAEQLVEKIRARLNIL